MPRNPRAKQPRQPGHPNPVDTYDKVVAAGLNPMFYGSCSEHIPNKNLGCGAWPLCNFPHKGKDRPRNKGMRIIKPGGARGVVMACYQAVQGPLLQLEVDENYYAEVAAEEGEPITLSGSVLTPSDIPGQLPTHKATTFESKVPPHPGIEELAGVMGTAAFTRHREQVRAERLERRKRDMLNLEDDDETETGAAALSIELESDGTKP